MLNALYFTHPHKFISIEFNGLIYTLLTKSLKAVRYWDKLLLLHIYTHIGQKILLKYTIHSFIHYLIYSLEIFPTKKSNKNIFSIVWIGNSAVHNWSREFFREILNGFLAENYFSSNMCVVLPCFIHSTNTLIICIHVIQVILYII